MKEIVLNLWDGSAARILLLLCLVAGFTASAEAKRTQLVYWNSQTTRWQRVPVHSSHFSSAISLRHAITAAANRHGVDPLLVVALVQVESRFNPSACSKKGAMGLMQLMPETARELGVLNPYNATENLDGGVRYLRELLVQFNDNVPWAIAAYNAGPQAVINFRGVPPYEETRNYVRSVGSLYLASIRSQLHGQTYEGRSK
jgi:soluble lytic murein transglycosylase-like protein